MNIFKFFKSQHEAYNRLKLKDLQPVVIQDKLILTIHLFHDIESKPGLNRRQILEFKKLLDNVHSNFVSAIDQYNIDQSQKSLISKLPAIKIDIDNLYNNLFEFKKNLSQK